MRGKTRVPFSTHAFLILNSEFLLEQLPVREAIAYCKDSAVEAAGAAPLGIFCCIYVRIADARETGRCKCRR